MVLSALLRKNLAFHESFTANVVTGAEFCHSFCALFSSEPTERNIKNCLQYPCTESVVKIFYSLHTEPTCLRVYGASQGEDIFYLRL